MSGYLLKTILDTTNNKKDRGLQDSTNNILIKMFFGKDNNMIIIYESCFSSACAFSVPNNCHYNHAITIILGSYINDKKPKIVKKSMTGMEIYDFLERNNLPINSHFQRSNPQISIKN